MRPQGLNTGTLLVAEPFMMDPFFRRSTVMLCEHHSEGSIGFIINKLLDIRIQELVTDFPEFDTLVYYGGPVKTDTLHFMHNLGDLLEDSLPICSGVYWGSNFNELVTLIEQGMITPDNIRFFVGYSGWEENQLEEEISTGSWIISDMDANYLFRILPDYLWKKSLQDLGSTYSVIAGMDDYPNWN